MACFMRVLNGARVRYAFEPHGLSFDGPAVSFYIKPVDGFDLPGRSSRRSRYGTM
ncbi:MAG: hypothetical protein LBK61_11660 [Spirochaetaceae bacterium]|nr:hypothetical protein [Spirochaetaceae bacterium]